MVEDEGAEERKGGGGEDEDGVGGAAGVDGPDDHAGWQLGAPRSQEALEVADAVLEVPRVGQLPAATLEVEQEQRHAASRMLPVPRPEDPPLPPGAARVASDQIGGALHVVGDSHVLSYAWRWLRLASTPDGVPRWHWVVPRVVIGLKAWHARPMRFQTHSNLHAALKTLPKSARLVMLSAGEIDCRENFSQRVLDDRLVPCVLALRPPSPGRHRP